MPRDRRYIGRERQDKGRKEQLECAGHIPHGPRVRHVRHSEEEADGSAQQPCGRVLVAGEDVHQAADDDRGEDEEAKALLLGSRKGPHVGPP